MHVSSPTKSAARRLRQPNQLLGLALLIALLAAAALTAAPLRAAPPDDLSLTLKLTNDSDNVVPGGSTLHFAAELSYGGPNPQAFTINDRTLLVSGDDLEEEPEWIYRRGARVLPFRPATETYSTTNGRRGHEVAVDEDPDGDIVAVGHVFDTVNGINWAGSVDLYVGGRFIARLTSDDPGESHNFGEHIAVGGGYLVVGEPGAEYRLQRDTTFYGAVHVFRVSDGSRAAKFQQGAADGCESTFSTRLGVAVAISDDGNTIVARQDQTSTCRKVNSVPTVNGASGVVFSKAPGAEWTNMLTTDSGAAKLFYEYDADHFAGALPDSARRNTGEQIKLANWGGAAISADGSRIALGVIGLPNRGAAHRRGGVMIFNRPASGGWVDAELDAFLTKPGAFPQRRIGEQLDMSADGGVVIASANGSYVSARGEGIKGSAILWARTADADSDWSGGDTVGPTAEFTNPNAVNGDFYGVDAAINSDASIAVVSYAYARGNDYLAGGAHIFNRPDDGNWVDDSTPNITLVSPQSGKQLFFGRGLALDGDALIIGQPEIATFLSFALGEDIDNIRTGIGNAYRFDLGAGTPAEIQASAVSMPCSSSLLDGVTTWTCLVHIGEAELEIPFDAPDGETITITAIVDVEGRKLSDSIEVTVGEVQEAASAVLSLPTDTKGDSDSSNDAPYPSLLNPGESTTLQLSILNANGTASAANSISTVLVSTDGGQLSSTAAGGCSGGLSCTLDGRRIDHANAANLRFTLTRLNSGASDRDSATVSAIVVSSDNRTLQTEPITITFAGPLDTLEFSGQSSALHHADTEDDAGGDQDNRDVLVLSVIGKDANGNRISAPESGKTVITGPDGQRVTSGIEATFPLTKPNDAGDAEEIVRDNSGNPQIKLDVDAVLKTGEYTLELNAGGKKAVQTVNVVGAPAAITLSELASPPALGERFVLSATVSDADGNPVVDGTPIVWGTGTTAGAPVLVQIEADGAVKNGSASAAFLVLNDAVGFVTAGAGTVAASKLIGAGGTLAPPSESLSSTEPDSYASYAGRQPILASDLLAELSGVSGIVRWAYGVWQRYGLSQGREHTTDFIINYGDAIWLSK